MPSTDNSSLILNVKDELPWEILTHAHTVCDVDWIGLFREPVRYEILDREEEPQNQIFPLFQAETNTNVEFVSVYAGFVV